MKDMKATTRKNQIKRPADKLNGTARSKKKKRESIAAMHSSIHWRDNLHMYAPFL